MNPEHFKGILWLADLQDDFELLDYKKFKDKNQIILVLGRQWREGLCSGCGNPCKNIHSKDRIWLRDLSAFGYQVILYVDRYTFWCERCQGYRVELHWLSRTRRSFTWRFEKHVSRLCEEMTNLAVARLESLDDKTVYNIDRQLLEIRLGHQKMPELGPHYSLDEVYFHYIPDWHKDAKNKFVTNLLDLQHRRIIANSVGRGEEAANNCFAWLSLTQKRQAQSVASDLHKAYHKSIRLNCPNADVVLDRFHIMQLFNEAMDDFRKQQLELASGTDEVFYLKGKSKWLLLTREEKLSEIDKRLLTELKEMNERVVEALLVREKFIQFFEASTLKEAKLRWQKVLKYVNAVDIKAFNEFFRKLKEWGDLLWNYFIHRTSSGVIEALNHKIKVTKSSAYGYRNIRYYQLKILQRCGFLNSQFAPLPRINRFQQKNA